MSLNSDEVNFLIYRYLQESGFQHSAFTFGYESMVAHSHISGAEVAPGALIHYLQKGLLYQQIETHTTENGLEIECDEPFNVLSPHVCQIKKRQADKDNFQQNKKMNIETSTNNLSSPNFVNILENLEVKENQVTILEGHTSEVFICAWNPKNPFMLASGSGDSTARIWNLNSGKSNSDSGSNSVAELKHFTNNQEKGKDVTTLDWNGEGTLLATGSYDGIARIWTTSGELQNTLHRHKGPIFSLKWNKKGDLLLSGSVDKTAIIWDAKTGEVKQQFETHTAPTLDVDWRDDTSFATCSTDKMIYVCELGKIKPLKCFQGHTDEVNTIKWDPSGTLLASCSDDFTAKIWSLKQDKCIYDFRQHTKEIYTIRWSPTGPGSVNPNKPLVLASASFDASIKIWDVTVGKEIFTLTKHVEPVYSVSFSPSGDFLASGSFDRSLHIWSVKDGSLVKTYKGNGGIFEVCWNSKGDKVAACYANHTICVINFP